MNRINASVMTVAAVLALIAFISPISAYSITTDEISCANGETIWEFTVSRSSGEQDISHWVVFWCNEGAVKGVWVDKGEGYEVHSWEYMPADHPDPNTELQGIKIDYTDSEGSLTLVKVKIVLDGEYCDQTSDEVKYAIKHGNDQGNKVHPGTVYGPVACTDPIPEFSTIAIPIASILGLLFFFNHRKRREK